MGEVIWLASTSRCGNINTSNEMGRYATFGTLMSNIIDDGSPLSADTEA